MEDRTFKVCSRKRPNSRFLGLQRPFQVIMQSEQCWTARAVEKSCSGMPSAESARAREAVYTQPKLENALRIGALRLDAINPACSLNAKAPWKFSLLPVTLWETNSQKKRQDTLPGGGGGEGATGGVKRGGATRV